MEMMDRNVMIAAGAIALILLIVVVIVVAFDPFCMGCAPKEVTFVTTTGEDFPVTETLRGKVILQGELSRNDRYRNVTVGLFSGQEMVKCSDLGDLSWRNQVKNVSINIRNTSFDTLVIYSPDFFSTGEKIDGVVFRNYNETDELPTLGWVSTDKEYPVSIDRPWHC